MPRRTDLKSILIIGAGPIVIGQACEFDYSGAQACKALREEGFRTILVNSNPATIMTDPGLADATYIEPIMPDFVERIIAREKPDALLPTMGGQTALNTAMQLSARGTLEKYGVELIGARADVIDRAEDRQKFRNAMAEIGIESPRSAIAHSLEEARTVLPGIGLPAVIRPSFTLGGTGGGIAYNRVEFDLVVQGGLDASPTGEVLVEESVLGWKEFEMEVVRDRADNCIIVCAIENVDPMGIHTGDSVTVAPALTLTDKEYQRMRDASIACLRKIGVDTGGSNVQFAVNPDDGRMLIIEMNPRVSRSSALASKATGFPIAKIAAKLAVGYTLDELPNDITKTTPASFEPTIDYVVVKIPRFTFEKFPGTAKLLTTSMKSVGEAMAIGGSFCEALQKGLRSMETGLFGLDPVPAPGDGGADAFRAALSAPRPERLLMAAQALRAGLSVEDVHAACRFDPWFLRQLARIIAAEREISRDGLPANAYGMRRVKALGFSDAQLARLTGAKTETVTARREKLARPSYRRVDTCAGEFFAETPYLYSTYVGGFYPPKSEAGPSDGQKIIILGGGPNRIGQGIEFDYCCVHAAYALREAGFETIMVNCNPETVSTDYDTSDRLYFEPLTAEDVIALARREQEGGTLLGCIVQYGGQTPLKLSRALEAAGIPILGTSPDAIDAAEDRERFQALLRTLALRQPENGTVRSLEEAEAVVARIGFPVVIRPSYVLGGRAMEIVHDSAGLHRYLREAVQASGENPVLIDRYLNDAIEVDVDCVADGEHAFVAGVMEHIEEAGIHSGDSACALPPYSLSPAIVAELRAQTEALAKALGVVGLMNVQFAIKDDEVFVLEVNPRASRTVPFVAKATGVPLAKLGRQGHGGRQTVGAAADRKDGNAARGGEGGGVPVQPLSGRGHDSWARNEVHRRGDGAGQQLRSRFRQKPARRRGAPARAGHRVFVRTRRRQAGGAGGGTAAARPGFLHPGHPRHRGATARGRTCGAAGQQGAGGTAALRGRDPLRRGAAGGQHRVRRAVGRRQFRYPPQRPDPWRAALYHHGRRPRRVPGDSGAAQRPPGRGAVTGLFPDCVVALRPSSACAAASFLFDQTRRGEHG